MSGAQYYTPARAARELFPPGPSGNPRSPASIVRLILVGSKLPDGSRAKLTATRDPSGWRVTRTDVERFLATLTEARRGTLSTSAVEDRVARADAELASMGWK